MMGANPKDVFVQGYCVDNNKFISATALLKKDINLKEKLGFNKSSKLVLYVGQIIKRKGIDNLFEIFTEFNNEGENIELVLLGTGPLEEYYKKQIVQNGIKNIHFKGFIQQDEILKYYAVADAFVLPSYEETWGLVVNEAMCAALPVIVSKRAGSSEDLVKHGKNGFVFDPNKKNELKSYILRICNNDSLKDQMGKASLEIIKKQSPENTALMISRCIRHAITKVKKD
jgi:glycosyltransferase involved in cell wall biosynthesis